MKQQAERGLGPVSAFTLAIGMMSATPLALAQESAPTAAAPAEAATPDLAPAAPAPAAAASAKAVNLEKIEVTGSRIRRVEAESIQQVVTSIEPRSSARALRQ